MEPRIMTFTGKFVNPLDLQPDDLDIRDIAHALALCNRFAGHTKFPISVAQHSIFVALKCPKYPLTALLHDASEAYIGDVTKWLKQTDAFAGYRAIEERIQSTINKKFGAHKVLPEEVKAADRLMVRIEGYRGYGPAFHIDHPDYPDMTEEEMFKYPVLYPWDWKTAEERFLKTFTALNGRDYPND